MGLEVFESAPIGYVFKLKKPNTTKHWCFYLKTTHDKYIRIYYGTPKWIRENLVRAENGSRYHSEYLKFLATMVVNPPAPLEDILWD
jgi:hypothetical protein